MEIQTLKIVYFSPTGTTKAIARRLAENFTRHPAQFIDITTPKARRDTISAEAHDLLVVAVPVYMGRVPAIIHDWLCSIRANKTPAVGLVVYGNRTYGDAFLELSHVISAGGGLLIAGAAFIGEHSLGNIHSQTLKAPLWRAARTRMTCAALTISLILSKVSCAHTGQPMTHLTYCFRVNILTKARQSFGMSILQS